METDVELLIEDLDDPNDLIRITAAERLKKLGDAARSAVPTLRGLLDSHPDAYVRLAMAASLAKIAPELTTPWAVLIEALDHPDPLHRQEACENLGERRHEAGVRQAAVLVGDPDFYVRFAAAEAVGRTFRDWSHAVSVCLEVFKDGNSPMRSLAGSRLLGVRHRIKDHLAEFSQTMMYEVRWEVRIEMEELHFLIRRT